MERELEIEKIKEERMPVAYHEVGHEIAVNWVRGLVRKISVIPEGRVLGHVEFILDKTRTLAEILRDRIFISVAGWAAEEIMGINDHSGTGDDMRKAQMCATLYRHFVSPEKSVSSIISEEFSRVKGALFSVGSRYLHQRSSQIVSESLPD